MTIDDSLGRQVKISITPRHLITAGRKSILTAPVDMILQPNMIALTAVWLKLGRLGRARSYRALLPETGETFPYRLKQRGNELVSSLGETFTLGEDGWVSDLVFAVPDFHARRTPRPWPRWSSAASPANLTYAPPDDLVVRDVRLGRGADQVDLTLVRPRSPPLAVGVFVGGTGVYSRHGFAPPVDLGYHQLLDDLARNGVASLRYERFRSGAANLAEAEAELDFSVLCAGAERALDYLSAQSRLPYTPRVLIGHSLGGLVALALAARRDDIAAVVALNTPGRSFRSLVSSQHRWWRGHLHLSPRGEAERQHLLEGLIAALESRRPWTEGTVDGRLLPLRRRARLFRSLLDLDPLDLIRAGTCPILIVQGTCDTQVSPADARKLAAAAGEVKRPVELIKAQGLDHLLRAAQHGGAKTLSAHHDRRRRIPIALIRDVAEWIARRVASHQRSR